MNIRRCGLEECHRMHYARGYCLMHYRRWTRHGADPATLRRPLGYKPPRYRLTNKGRLAAGLAPRYLELSA